MIATSEPPRRRILFVDDEQQVLDGLQNLLRKQRRQWEMAFALGGTAALTACDGPPFDVVVSDMRMPGVDGVALLTAVRDRHPAAARIVLSGHADPDAVRGAMAVAHQFLAKPCDAEVLRLVIERVCGTQELLASAPLRQLIGRVDRLPSVPAMYLELVAMADRAAVTLPEIAEVVERDPAMAAKVLQLVNSSFFGLPRRLSSVADAVGYLGVDLVRSLALTAQVFARQPRVPGLSIEQLQDRAIVGARLARAFLGSDRKRADQAFTAALLRDVGVLVLAAEMPDAYAPIVAAATGLGATLAAAEVAALAVSHAEVGAYLLGVWGLPAAIVEAVAHHHAPGRVRHDDRDVLWAVHVADAVATAATEGGTPEFAAELATDPRFRARLSTWLAIAPHELARLGLHRPG